MTSQQQQLATTVENDDADRAGPADEGDTRTALTVERRAIDGLRPHPLNYRRHPESQFEVLRQSLRDHGLQKPVVVTPDGTILAGHGLVEAAKAEGWTEIAVHVYDGPHPDAFVVADNFSASLAVDDEQALAELLTRLEADGELSASGYQEDDLAELLARLEAEEKSGREETFDAEGAMAEAEQQQGPTRVQPGELWQLGRHRLLCGDATDPANWERLMQGQLAHAVITDPPYAINYLGGRAAQEERISARRRGIDGGGGDAYWDNLTDDEYRALLIGSLSLAYQHSDDKAPLYLWFASSHLRDVLGCLAECGWQERNLLVWVKNNGAGALFAQYKHWYEPCFYAFKKGQAPRWHGPTNERTVWEHDKPTVNDLHPTMKPVALIERSIQNATELGQLVADAFLGSGTAIIAAERTGRKCYGFDLDARYCDVILARFEQFAQAEAVKLDG
jgi:DNA modification methylase